MTFFCKNLNFSYHQTKILDNITFEIPSGVFCAILGRNGSGKTTLLHCLNGLLRPSSGRIELNGLNILKSGQKEIARRISMVPQEHSDIFPFQVQEVVVMGRTPYLGFNESPGPDDYDKASEILASLGAGHLAKRNYNRISGGERRIALLARAIMQTSETLLLDEPTNHLDFHNQYRILSMIKNFCREKGSGIIASMHDPNLAGLFADRIIMLKDGKIMKQEKKKKILNADSVGELYDTTTSRHRINEKLNFYIPGSFKSDFKQ